MERHHNLLNTAPTIHDSLSAHPFGYAVVGGLVTDALLDERTHIDYKHHRVTFSPDTVVSSLRPNGTPKDIDILAFTTKQHLVRQGSGELRATLSEEYPHTSVSLSGYDTSHNETSLQIVTRTVAYGDETLCLSMGSVRQEIPNTHLEDTWTARYGDHELRVLHPVAQLASYKTRSITGIRPKDAVKVKQLEDRLMNELPRSEWAPYKPWDKFAQNVKEAYTLKRLFEQPDRLQLKMTLGRVGLGMIERSPRLVALSQDNTTYLARLAQAVLRRSKPGYQMDI